MQVVPHWIIRECTILLSLAMASVKDGILRLFGFQIWVLWDLASTYVLCWPHSSSLYFGRSQGLQLLGLVMSEECNLS